MKKLGPTSHLNDFPEALTPAEATEFMAGLPIAYLMVSPGSRAELVQVAQVTTCRLSPALPKCKPPTLLSFGTFARASLFLNFSKCRYCVCHTGFVIQSSCAVAVTIKDHMTKLSLAHCVDLSFVVQSHVAPTEISCLNKLTHPTFKPLLLSSMSTPWYRSRLSARNGNKSCKTLLDKQITAWSQTQFSMF